MFSVRTVLGDKGLRSGASAKLPESRPPAHWTGRGAVIEGVMFGELSILLLLCFVLCFFGLILGVCMGVWEWMCE